MKYPMQRIPALFALLALSALPGCASMSGDECKLADWYTVGFEDGSRGANAGAIGRHREACAEHGVAPDLHAYQAGRAEGLKEFCRPATGFRLGSGGSSYAGVCPDELETEFLPAYQDGRHLYQLQSQVKAVDAQIRSKNGEMETLKQTLSEDQELVIQGGKSKEERILLLKEIWALAKHQGQLEEEILALEKDRVLRIQELENYRTEVANLY